MLRSDTWGVGLSWRYLRSLLKKFFAHLNVDIGLWALITMGIDYYASLGDISPEFERKRNADSALQQ